MEDSYGQVFWDNTHQGYYFWDDADMLVGWWDTKDEAALAYEEYCYHLDNTMGR
jgi:Leu/Phe-tRNA-protein transferase